LDKFRTYSVKAILLILALQILNSIVYSRSYEYFVKDENGHTVVEDNQIDSFVEYVAEVIFNITDAFPEDPKTLSIGHEDNNYKTPHTIIKNTMIQLAVPVLYTGCGQNVSQTTKPEFSGYKDYSYLFSREINPPPPKA
jgi:hypothetical protein